MRHVAIEPRPWRAPAEVLSAFGTETGTCAFLSGGEGARARWSYLLRSPDAALRIGRGEARDAFSDLEAISLGSGAALVLGRWSLAGERPLGGVFSVVLRRFDEGWRIIHDHTSLVPPAP